MVIKRCWFNTNFPNECKSKKLDKHNLRDKGDDKSNYSPQSTSRKREDTQKKIVKHNERDPKTHPQYFAA